MTPRLLAFVRLLREQGLRVSVAESLVALESIGHVGLDDRELLRLSLRTVLIKSQRDFALFDTLFQRFFTVPRRRKRRRAKHQHHSGNDEGKGPKQGPRQGGASSAAQQSLQALDQHKGGSPADALQSSVQNRLEALEQAWQRQLKAPLGPVVTQPERSGAQALHTRIDRPFPPDRLEDMYRQIERLAIKLLTRRALRYRRARHGRIDLRGTVLRGLRSGTEIPFNLMHRRRKQTKLRLMVLCDVSGSVWQVSTFLLKLVRTLQAEFSQVRSLVFVNSIVEVTELIRRMRFPHDLKNLRQYPQLNLFGFSDFGRAFYQFYRDYLDELTRETVVVILGDARNNAFDAQFWTLDEIRQRSRRILWLNPEPRRDWNTGDSIIGVYAPFCDDVLECWTLDHLEQAANQMLRV
jgi:uncharacterized protein with von Willebrand factor type A (vWA) domain